MGVVSKLLEIGLSQLLGFILGALSSFLASIWFTKWWARRSYKQYGSLVGTWIEVNNILQDRPFSVCNFYFSTSDGKLHFNGHSFNNNAEEYYRWWSVVLHIDDRNRRMSYVYETQLVGDTKKDEGFGCYSMRFNETLKRWDIISGYFLDLDEARPRYCRMLRFEDVASFLKRQLDPCSEQDQRFVVNELLKCKDDTMIKSFFGW